MEFKIGDKVIINPEMEIIGGRLGTILSHGRSPDAYIVAIDGLSGTGLFLNYDLLPATPRTETERRLIEALRPFAEEEKPYSDANVKDLRAAAALLRELGEYPETCKECGQEIRK